MPSLHGLPWTSQPLPTLRRPEETPASNGSRSQCCQRTCRGKPNFGAAGSSNNRINEICKAVNNIERRLKRRFEDIESAVEENTLTEEHVRKIAKDSLQADLAQIRTEIAALRQQSSPPALHRQVASPARPGSSPARPGTATASPSRVKPRTPAGPRRRQPAPSGSSQKQQRSRQIIEEEEISETLHF